MRTILPAVLVAAALALGPLTGAAQSYRTDPAAYAERLKPQAEAGDVGAQALLGRLYVVGLGVERDPATAVTWLEPAAAAGHVDAAVMLARLYRSGDGVERDAEKARALYDDVAGLGHVAALTALGEMQRDGEGGPADRGEAYASFSLATAIAAHIARSTGSEIALTRHGHSLELRKELDAELTDEEKEAALARANARMAEIQERLNARAAEATGPGR